MIRLGEAAEAFDPKLDAIAREVRAIRAVHPATNILIYTEYADSQLAALRALRGAVEGEVLAINGLDTERERTRIAERFAEEDGIVLVSTDSLAEGLNLQQRCCNLIHLDLPYNPNRLEQRNGRIDRYGQEHDPQIRYLYLAGTFEERLLLRLIAKYEKARAQLRSCRTRSGSRRMRRHGARAWSPVSPSVRRACSTMNHRRSARWTGWRKRRTRTAYRDLLHEIDRAFDGFDRSAVRHGWMADHGLNAGAAQMAAASACAAAERCGSRSHRPAGLRGSGDCRRNRWQRRRPESVASSCRLACGARRSAGVRSRAPCAPFHAQPRPVARQAGHSLAFLGRAHPVVRRAINRAQRIAGTVWDNRVSVARADAGASPAVLLTFSVEMRSAVRTEFQRVIAVLLPAQGDAVEVNEPERWLQLAAPDRSLLAGDVWQTLFAHWVPNRQPEAASVASAAMQRDAARFTADHQRKAEREAGDLQDWLRRRADDICGAFVPQTGDLFGATKVGPDWRLLSAPLERLAAFTARRRQFTGTTSRGEQCHRAVPAAAAWNGAALSPPVLSLIGMLMLVPSARA